MSTPIRNCFRSNRSGQVLPIVAGSIVALLALLSLGIDLGMAYTARVEAQRVADAASLAGASAYLDHVDPINAVSDAIERAKDYSAVNGVRGEAVDTAGMVVSADGTTATNENLEIGVSPLDRTVRVWVRRGGLPSWFARVFGVEELTVSAAATARAIYASSSECLMPFAIPDMWQEKDLLEEDVDDNDIYDFDRYWITSDDDTPGTYEPSEWWEYQPEVDGDDARPFADGETLPTGLGSGYGGRPVEDNGLRIMLRPPNTAPKGSLPEHLNNLPDQLSNWWQFWNPPGEPNSASVLMDMIREGGCHDLAEHDRGVGDDIEVFNGAVAGVYDAVTDFIDANDPDLIWDEEAGAPVRVDASGNVLKDEDGNKIVVMESKRVISVPVVSAEILLRDPSDQAKYYEPVQQIASMFLEDPRKPPFNGKPQVDANVPLTGRILHRGAGATGGSKAGTIEMYLRLVK